MFSVRKGAFVSPMQREATRVKTVLLLAHLAGLASQHISLNQGPARTRQ